MEDFNTQIDQLFKKERRKNIVARIRGILIVAVIAGIMLVLTIPPMGKRTLVYGKVESMVGRPSEVGDHLYLVVKLEDGAKVRPAIPSSIFYKQGKVVKLEKIEPRYFGPASYKFLGYEEEPLSE